MMAEYWALLPVAVYLFVLGWILWKTLAEEKTGPQDARAHALGIRPYGWAIVAMTLVGTIVGPADTLVLSEQTHKLGLYFLLFPAFAALQQIVFGTYFVRHVQDEAGDCRTVGDIMCKYYNRPAQIVTGLSTVAQALAFTGILCLAGGQIVKALLGVDQIWGIVGTALFVGIYTSLGGMHAVIKTDLVQFGFIIAFAFFGLVIAGATLLSGGPVPSEWMWRPDQASLEPAFVVTTVVSYFLGEAFLPVYAIRGLIAKSPSDARTGFRLAGLVIMVLYLAFGLVGIAGNRMETSPTGTNNLLADVYAGWIDSAPLRWLVVGCVLAALLSLVHSTLDSVLNAGSTAFIRDLLGQVVKLDDAEEKSYSRNAVIVIAIFGTMFSVVSESLLDILMIGYAIWVPTVVLPFGYLLLRKKRIRSRWSAGVAIVCGATSYWVGPLIFGENPWFPALMWGVVGNAAGLAICEVIGRPGVRDTVAV